LRPKIRIRSSQNMAEEIYPLGLMILELFDIASSQDIQEMRAIKNSTTHDAAIKRLLASDAS